LTGFSTVFAAFGMDSHYVSCRDWEVICESWPALLVHRLRPRVKGSVSANPKAAGGGAERETVADFVDGERMAVNDVISVLLRSAGAQHVEILAGVAPCA
jgi:hypothetical protein